MVSHSEESIERGAASSPPCSPPRRFIGRCESVESSSSTDSCGSSGSSASSSASSSGSSVDKRLNLTSALHRLLTFPVGLAEKLRLDVRSLAAVGFFWNGRQLECFRCHQKEQQVTPWQDLKQLQIQLKHYECTHPSEDDIPPSSAACSLNYEAHRLLSFYQNSSWKCTFVQPSDLAENGFYYTGRDDICKCHFCNLEMKDWEAGDTPAGEHKRWNPECPLVKNKPIGNFRLGAEIRRKVASDGLEIKPFTKAENDMRRALPDVVPRNKALQPPPTHPHMKTEDARMVSFKNWPNKYPMKPADLVEAGFFYTGMDDAVLCFHCGGGLKDWKAGEEPWVMHAKWFSSCKFLMESQGRDFILSVLRVHKAILTSKQFKEAMITTEKSQLERGSSMTKDSQQQTCKLLHVGPFEVLKNPSFRKSMVAPQP
ncbi:death-associated inhibitor of apoptosis 1-like isoform X2 [Neocloeon triangulifer]|nr:death-associated inhibitor of apoptosis 1-like isoform X2 [Neocloeon triangulifer]